MGVVDCEALSIHTGGSLVECRPEPFDTFMCKDTASKIWHTIFAFEAGLNKLLMTVTLTYNSAGFFVNGTIFQYSTGASLVCNQETHQPTTNLYAETYGPGSRCVEHGRQWFQTMSGTNSTSAVYGGGCYQVWLCIKLTHTYLLASYFTMKLTAGLLIPLLWHKLH